MNPTYKTTKQFIEWLKEVKPEFIITHRDYMLDVTIEAGALGSFNKIRYESNPNKTPVSVTDEYSFILPLFTIDTLHDILWELFDVITPEDEQFQNCPKYYADYLWAYYTWGKESMWGTEPDGVLEDIMKIYNELNT